MEQNRKICSRSEVERYLLNRMSPDEETLFQEHLATCSQCRAYLQTVRSLSGFVGEENLQFVSLQDKEEQKRKKQGSLYYWISIAASVIVVLSVSFYFLNKEPEGEGNQLATSEVPTDPILTVPEDTISVPPVTEEPQPTTEEPESKEPEKDKAHDLSITHQHRAATDEVEVQLELLFPKESISNYVLSEGPLVFKWNKESQYHIVISAGEETIVDVKGSDKQYTVDTDKIRSYRVIDWILTFEGQERKGRIFLK